MWIFLLFELFFCNLEVKMSIDPDELKVSKIKQESQFKEVQSYRDEQEALDKQDKTGKIENRQVKMKTPNEKIGKTVNGLFNSLKTKEK